MGLTYARKRRLLEYMSDPDVWRNDFPAEWLAKEERKWPVVRSGNVSLHTHPDQTVVIAEHKNGAFLRIERAIDGLVVSDESGSIVFVSKKGVRQKDGPKVSTCELSHVKELEIIGSSDEDRAVVGAMNVYIGFNTDTGEKEIVLDDYSGQKITFPKRSAEIEQEMHRTRFFHSTEFGPKDVERAVLVAAFDLALEPSLITFNAMSNKELERFLKEAMERGDRDADQGNFLDTSGWRGDAHDDGAAAIIPPGIRDLEIPWHDTVEFKGHCIAVPSMFMVQKTDTGSIIATSLDDRDKVISSGIALQSALQMGHRSGQQYRPKRGQVGNILSLITTGGVTSNHVGEDWCYTIVEAQKSGVTAGHIRTVLGHNMGLSGREFAAISYDPQHVMVAIDAKAHQKATQALRATRQVMRAIETGKTGGMEISEFLREQFELGASLRHIDPEGVEKGRTFQAVMVENDQFEMRAALDELQGTAKVMDTPSSEPS